ncbi:gamma-glutamylcyclotransferase family protein [candidate division KSB1 bacterium]
MGNKTVMKKANKILFFAYGSNMSHSQMNESCPGSKFIKRAILKDYKFVYDGNSDKGAGASGNIVKSKNSKVYGGLFEISEQNLAELDKGDGYAENYDRIEVEVKDDENISYEAFVYFRKWKRKGKPHPLYRKIVIMGARDCGLSEEYIADNL